MSGAIEHTVYRQISPVDLERISKLTSEDITSEAFRDPDSWPDLRNVLIYHPNPITRHEASFVIADLQIDELVPSLFSVLKFDTSIVAKHEAAEALGKTKNPVLARRVLKRLETFTRRGYDAEVYHPDVQRTIVDAVASLKGYLGGLSKR